MQQKSKRIVVALLAVVLALVLGAGLLFVFLPNGVRKSDKIAELSEDDFEFRYVSSLAYSADTEQTSGDKGVYGWGYDNSDKSKAEYAYITKIDNAKLEDLIKEGVTKLVLNIPEMHNGVPVQYVAYNAFANCALTITDIRMPLSVYWQIHKDTVFKFDNNSDFARADGQTATFTGFKQLSGSGITTLILPSNVWIDKDGDGVMDASEPKYRYTEYLFKGDSSAAYTNLVVMPDVVNIFNGEKGSSANRPKLQGGLLSKSKTLESVYFCTGRSEVLHLYPLTFENCTSLREISLSAGVYLEDGARVFQGSSALEKFFIADEKTASAPLFYMVGADGALYTNNYSYSYFTQSSTERYYEWWKNGLTEIGSCDQSNFKNEWIPTKVWDSQTNVDSLNLTDPTVSTQQGTFAGDKSSVAPAAKTYYAKGSDGEYTTGIGVPEGSYVFDFNDGSSTDNDFATGEGEGNYPVGANFESLSVDARFNTETTVNLGGITLTGTSGTTVDKTPRYFQTEGGKTYTYAPQIKQARPIKVNVPFDFTMTAYFVRKSDDTSTSTKLGLYKGWNGKKGTLVGEKITDAPLATEGKTNNSDFTSLSTGLLQTGTLSANTEYSIVEDGSTGLFRLLALVITPISEQVVSSILVEQNVNLSSDSPDWQRIPNDALLFQKIPDTSYFLDLRYPTIVRYDKTCEIPFRVKALSSTGENLPSLDIDWAIMEVDGQDVSKNLSLESPAQKANQDGYFTFTLHLKEVFDNSDFYGEGQQKHGKNFAVKFTAGDVTKYIFFNLLPDSSDKEIPDADQWYESDPDPKPQYLPLVQENASRYQTLISMPAKAKNDEGAYVNSFNFGYHETVEIGANAFQNTFITVIDIPDRIAKIGASAFRFSDHLQTVYLPDAADIGLNAFGQEPDASPQDGTVYTAGKMNFFLIAPSRTSFEQYLRYASVYYESGQKELVHPNYNVFPVHAEEENMGGFQDWGGKDASYDYTPYLTYEIAVDFLTYDPEGKLQRTEARTFLYGMDVRYVKATATTEWAAFDKQYDNNAPVYFGRIQNVDGNVTVQQVNTMSAKIAWSVAADGWYYDENAVLPEGNWYFGETQVTNLGEETTPEEELTKFLGGWKGSHVGSVSIQNLVQVHYADVYDQSSAQAITETGGEPTDLRVPITEWSDWDSEDYYLTGADTGFEKQTRWNRWWWDEKFQIPQGEGRYETGAVVQRFFTMPFSITLNNVSAEPEKTIEYDVPTFQNIGEVTYGDDTMNAAPAGVRDSTWKVPMLTVTFDYNGFPVSRIFENFRSGAMQVSYEAWQRGYADKEWRWYDKDSANWSTGDWEKMRYEIDDNYVPYDAGYYKITLSFESSGSGGYTYNWSGVYNGMRVEAGAGIETKFTFILHIEPRKVPLSNVYSMQYTGQGFSLFEDNPYIDVVSYGYWSDGHADYTAEGLPRAVGRYLIKLKLHDPKYPNPNDDYSYDINKYTPNLEWEGANGYNKSNGYTRYEENDGRVNRYIYEDGVELFILDGTTEVSWGMLYEGDDEDRYLTFTSSLAMFGSEIKTLTYTGAPISMEEVFGGVFSSSSINYTITRNGSTVSEINNAGTYIVTITPADGYVWWRGIPTVNEMAQFHIDEWSLDAFWEDRGGYEAHKRDTLVFEVNVDKRSVNVPMDSYTPASSKPPYEFEVPIGGDYEVMGYHLHDFETNVIPAASSKDWKTVVFDTGVYDVLLRLTDPANTTWYPDAGEAHGENFYVTVRLYAGFDREKTYPSFQEGLGEVTGEHAEGKWVTLTRTYDGKAYSIDTLFNEDRPTDREATYTIYQLFENPDSASRCPLGEEVRSLKDVGYYGITVILYDPFLYKGTSLTAAYYLVHVEKAKIEATFRLSASGSNGGNATYDGTDRLKELNTDGGMVTFATTFDALTVDLTVEKDYRVIVSSPVNAAEMIDAGEYTVNVELTSSEVASNYKLTGGEARFVIDARPLTLDLGEIKGHTYLDAPAEDWHTKEEFAYQGNTEGAVVTRNGVPDDLQMSYQFVFGESTFSSLGALSDAGEYTVQATCGNFNYEVTLKATAYTVAQRQLALNAPASASYSGAEQKPNLTFSNLPGNYVLVEGEANDYTVSFAAEGGAKLGDAKLPLTAGSYTVTVTLVSKNYIFADGDAATATFEIEKTTLATPYLLSASFPYTGNDLLGSVRAALGNYMEGKMTVAFYETNDGTGEDLPEIEDAGNYFLKVSLTDLSYRWEGERTELYLPFTISKFVHGSVAITASNVQATYGDGAEKLHPTVSGVPEGYEVSYLYTYVGTDGTSYALSPKAPEDVGKYTVTVTAVYAGDANHEPFSASATATLTIAARELTFSLSSSEGAGELVNAVFKDENGNSVALAATDYTFAYTLNGTAVESMSAAGDYTVTVTLSGDAAKNNTLTNATAVYKLTQGIGGQTAPVNPADIDDGLDFGGALILFGTEVILLGTAFGLAVKKKNSNEVEN